MEINRQEGKIDNRIGWIDISKGIGICLVILGHTYRANPVLNWICSFHMPLFFILSGWLRGMKQNKYKKTEYISRKFDALIIPLIIFMVLTYLYWLIIEHHFREFSMGPMWFLPILFTAEIAIELLIMRKPNIVTLAAGGALSGVLLYLTQSFEVASIMAWIPRCFGAAMFYMIGMMVSYVLSVKEIMRKDRREINCAMIILFVLSVTISQINGRVDLYNLMFGNYVLYIIAALTGSGAIYCISVLIGNNVFFEYLGRYSIIILCTHEQIKRAVIMIAGRIIGVSHEELRNQIFAGLIISAIVLLIDLVVIQICRFIADKIRETKLERIVRFIR